MKVKSLFLILIFLLLVTAVEAQLIQTIDTSKYSPPSPDPAGVVYLASGNRLLISDSEVNEMSIFAGKNLFYAKLSGSLLETATTTSFSNEPTGVTINPANGHIFISDDIKKDIYEVDIGADNLFGTSDDVVTSFSTDSFGGGDPEGVTFDTLRNHLYIADGIGNKVYKVNPGPNGLFDGIDHIITSFDTLSLGVTDPEGIAYNERTDTIYFVGAPENVVAEATIGGKLVTLHDISAAKAKKPAGMTFGPGSATSSDYNLYIVDRVVDNKNDPNENDGKLYEFSFGDSQPPVGADTNGDGCVSIVEIVAYVELWQNGQVTIQQVVAGVEKWQLGCL
jgi:hypothetical protein